MDLKKYPVIFHSSFNLERWDWSNPWTTGIGGSETEHIEMATRLHKRGFKIYSYTPCQYEIFVKSPENVVWKNSDNFTPKAKGIYLWHRDPVQLKKKLKGQIYWFIAQDVGYDFSNEQLEMIDRYICLCKEHAFYTLSKYSALKNKVYISSNGIRSDYIKDLLKEPRHKRNPNRLFFPSSPDRGLKFLLRNWFRIKEINPKASLNVAYGFNNMDAIKKLYGPDWRVEYKTELEHLLNQKDINFLGRIPQQEIYKQWLETGIWAHPTDFPETSCITCMEAQALGAYPVTNDYWALKDNVKYGWMVLGIPQKSELTQTNWLHALDQSFGADDKERGEMSEWALENFDWENICDQWQHWIVEDFKKI